MGANDALIDRAIRHAHFFERLKTPEVTAMLKFLEADVYADLTKRIQGELGSIASGAKLTPAKRKRLKQLHAAVRAEIQVGMRKANGLLKAKLERIGFSEAQWQTSALKSVVGVDFVTPSPALVRGIVSSKPMEGRLLSKWMADQGSKTANAVQSQINIGMANGESVDAIVKRVRGTKAAQFADGVWGKSKREVDAIVRTSMNHISTQAKEAVYAENLDVIKAVGIVATLDARTTEICIDQDGREYPVNSGPRPPFHFRCRTTTIPITKSFEELGVKTQKQIPEGTRASMNGQVPAKKTYPEWLKGQPDSVQKEVLGPGRMKLFKEGKITRFADDRGRPLTLEQLHKVEKRPKPVSVGIEPEPVVPKPVVPKVKVAPSGTAFEVKPVFDADLELATRRLVGDGEKNFKSVAGWSKSEIQQLADRNHVRQLWIDVDVHEKALAKLGVDIADDLVYYDKLNVLGKARSQYLTKYSEMPVRFKAPKVPGGVVEVQDAMGVIKLPPGTKEIRLGSKPKLGAPKEVMEGILEERDKAFKRAPPGRQKQLLAEVKAELDQAEVFVRVENRDLLNILDEGKLKNQFETQTSGGFFNPEMRRDIEGALFDTPKNLAYADRPVYGYISTAKDGLTNNAKTGISGYGDVAIKLKRSSTRKRTTWTGGDSLSDNEKLWAGVKNSPDGKPTAAWYDVTPSKLDNPDLASLSQSVVRKNVKPKKSGFKLDSLFDSRSYAEAQIHGGVTLADIEALVITEADAAKVWFPRLAEKAKDLKVKIQIVDKSGKTVRTL